MIACRLLHHWPQFALALATEVCEEAVSALPRRSMRSLVRSVVLGSVAVLAACSSESVVVAPGAGTPGTGPTCSGDTECSATASTPLCDTAAKACVPLPAGHEIGYRDGSPTSVTFTEIYAASATAKPVDLAFRGEAELWVVGYGDNALYRGSGLDTDAPTFKKIIDPAAGHFMLKPPAIAMGTPEYFGTCGDNLNEQGGGDGSNALFMGPALFSTDPAILGKRTSGGLGSHMDMLHNTPLCRGIAHEKANVYWVFNGMDHSLDKYDFNADHGPGNDDHSDGEIYRYAMGKVKGVSGTDGTPSHVFFDADDSFLYVADTGNQRIVKLDTTKGKMGGELERQNEPLKAQAVMLDTDVEEVVPPGTLEKPSGLEVYKGNIYVTDTATSTFHVFDKTGKELRRLETGLPPGSLAGMAFSPTGKLYFTDKVAGKVLRIDTQ